MAARVTVIVPTFNRASLLGECLASILSQDCPDLDVVVADNASEDETLASSPAWVITGSPTYAESETSAGGRTSTRHWATFGPST